MIVENELDKKEFRTSSSMYSEVMIGQDMMIVDGIATIWGRQNNRTAIQNRACMSPTGCVQNSQSEAIAVVAHKIRPMEPIVQPSAGWRAPQRKERAATFSLFSFNVNPENAPITS